MTLLSVEDRVGDGLVTVLNGATRTVVLVGRYAIKLPSLRYGWRPFLRGLLANGQEREWWRAMQHERLCPVLFSLPGGFLVVMPRCEPIAHLTDAVYADFVDVRCCDHTDDVHVIGGPCALCPDEEPWHDFDAWTLPAECKDDSFGWLGGWGDESAGRLVAIDYGN